MPSLRAASGVLSLLISCPAAARAERQTDRHDNSAAFSENLLLQLSHSQKSHSAISVNGGSVSRQRNASMAAQPERRGRNEEFDLEKSPKQNSSCSSACEYNGAFHDCRARVKWSLDADGERDLVDALDRVNKECAGQCECSSEDFSASWDEQWLHGRGGECSTAVDGERCYKAVEWARTHGIHIHPLRYEGLTSGSTFAEFQEFLYKNRLEHCMRPCDVCHTAEPGETCHTAVTEAMAREDVELSTFEEVQALLNRTDVNSSCPMPCNLCHTAQPGEACFKGVRWAMQWGIHIHPDRYPGLSAESSFEDFQNVLHQANQERCAMPCLSASDTQRKTATGASAGDASVNGTEPHMEIDTTVAPTATSEEPTMHMMETSEAPAGTDTDTKPHMEVDSFEEPTATSEEPDMSTTDMSFA
jgi:hypothetical protein